jgi:stage II sporulation protein AA (anti-sigma F factor antagonist)
MEIQSEQYQQTLVVSLAGSLDALTADQAQATIGTQLNGGQQQVVLDLSRVDFMSSSGIRLLLEMLKRSREVGGDLCLVAAQPGVQRTLEISGLVRILKIYPSVEEAVRSSGLQEP